MEETKPLNEYEKIRLRLKIMWEGGLSGYIEYGVAHCLYIAFMEDFKNIYRIEDEIELLKKQNKKVTRKVIKTLILARNKLEAKLEVYLGGNIQSWNMKSIDPSTYEGVDLNDYNYIL